MSTLIVTNGNDLQIPFIIRFHQRLIHDHYGNYSGDFLVVSDYFSEQGLDLLSQRGVPVRLFESEKIDAWKNLFPAAEHPLGKLGKPLFIRAVIEQFGQNYTNILYFDPDILIQKPLQPLIDKITNNKLLISSEQRANPWAFNQLKRAVRYEDVDEAILHAYNLEINTGFMAGRIDFMQTYLSEFITFMTSETFRKYAISDPGQSNAWHDQDYFRCFIRLYGVQNLDVLNSEWIIHLCTGAHEDVLVEPSTSVVSLKQSQTIPTLVHFAGGSVKYFREFKAYYQLNKIYTLLGFPTFPHRSDSKPPTALHKILRSFFINVFQGLVIFYTGMPRKGQQGLRWCFMNGVRKIVPQRIYKQLRAHYHWYQKIQ